MPAALPTRDGRRATRISLACSGSSHPHDEPQPDQRLTTPSGLPTKLCCMDPLKGAEMLRHRLGKEGVERRQAATAAVAVPQSAPPLFHWLGVQPADAPEEHGAASGRSPR